jgi:peptidyl-prolyl cis-trans isomerase D
MITFMRRYRRGLQVGLLLVIAAFVASLFVFGSSGFDAGGERGDAVATVNGTPISTTRYRRAYQNTLDRHAQAGQRLTAEMAEQVGLPQMVIDSLIRQEVVIQKARAEGLEATDEEINTAVHTIKAFQEDGRFTRRRFEQVLQRAGLREAELVDDLRRDLTVMKLQRLIAGGAHVTDAEVDQAWQLRHAEVRAAWALVEMAPLVAAATTTDDEVAEYLKAHGDEFRQPERRKVQYVTLVAKDFTPKVSDAEVEKYYTEHVKEYETPRQVQAAHVLVRVGETGGSEAEDRARAKVAEVIKRAKAGEDFGKLAREVSEDPGSKDQGGDLGLVSQGMMVAPFEQALFALKKGEVSPEPVRTPFGFHAIKVSDVREGFRKPLKEVATQIRDRLATDAADRAARAKADEIRPALQAAADFMTEARKLGLTPVETTMSKLGRPPVMPGMPPTDTLEEAAFGLAVGGVTPPVNTPAGWVVLKVTSVIPPGVPPLAEIRDRVVTAVKRSKAETVAATRVKQLAEDARAGDLAAAAKKAGATFGETPRFSRAKPADRLPGDVQLAALQTPAGQTSQPVKTPQGYYVVKVLEHTPAGAVNAAEREKLKAELVSQKHNQTWERWVLTARGEAKIDILGQRPPGRG